MKRTGESDETGEPPDGARGPLTVKGIPLDPNLVHYKQLSLVGSHDFTPHDFTNALKLMATGVVRVQPLISHVLPLEETEKAFRMVAGRQGLKLMVEMPAA